MKTLMQRAALRCSIILSVAFSLFSQTSDRTLGTYTYDGSGSVKSIGPDSAGLTNVYDYDSAGRLIQFVQKNASGTVILKEMFEYDAYGNLTKRTTNNAVTSLTAGADTNRLTSAAYNAAGDMTQYGGETYVFDPVGTLTRKSGSWGNAFYIYTADDERIGIEGPDGTWRYMGRDLDGKVLREWAATTWNGNLNWVEDYVYRDGALAAAARPASQGGTRHFHLDHLGTPRLITGDNRSVYADHAYYPFGAEYTSPTQELDIGHDTPEPMRFTGHERDFAGSYTGPVLDYMHARYYNPAAGRFLSVDPVLDPRALRRPQSWNRYSYVLNNPLRYTDPTGMLWFKLDDKWTYLKDTAEITQVAANKDGTTTTTVIKGVKFGLVFNGTGLTQLREDGTTRTLPAVSGSVSGWGEINPGQQGERNRGPIPEGTYTFNRSDIQTFDGPNYDINLLATALGRGWRGGTHAWGTQRVFLNPMPGTNTRGRYGFSIHGGAVPGSAGCIDLCDMVNVFFSEIPRSANEIPVDVDYSDPLP